MISNLCAKAKNRFVSVETREKLSLASKGRSPSKEAIEKRVQSKRKPVICLDTGIVYNSAKEAEILLGLGHNVSSVCKGKRKSTGKLKFKYYE